MAGKIFRNRDKPSAIPEMWQGMHFGELTYTSNTREDQQSEHRSSTAEAVNTEIDINQTRPNRTAETNPCT